MYYFSRQSSVAKLCPYCFVDHLLNTTVVGSAGGMCQFAIGGTLSLKPQSKPIMLLHIIGIASLTDSL